MLCLIIFAFEFVESLENSRENQVIVSTKNPKAFVTFVTPITMEN